MTKRNIRFKTCKSSFLRYERHHFLNLVFTFEQLGLWLIININAPAFQNR